MKKTKQKEVFAEDVASKNEIWQHRISGEKFIVVRINKKSIGLLPLDCNHQKRFEYLHGSLTAKGKTKKKTLKNWTTVCADKINEEFQFLYKMVMA